MRRFFSLSILLLMVVACTKQSNSYFVRDTNFVAPDSVTNAIVDWINSDYEVDTTQWDLLKFTVEVDTLDICSEYITLRRLVTGYYQGACHDFHVVRTATFYPNRTQPLNWDDVFTNIPQEKFMDALCKELYRQHSDKLPEDQTTFPLPSKCLPCLVNDSVMLTYQEYDIAPYCFGRIAVTVIPYK